MNKERLFSLLNEIVMTSDLQPERLPDGTIETHCNFAVIRIASYFGCNDFIHGPNANTIYTIVKTSNAWVQATGKEAQDFANKGQFVIASKQYEEHGHCAIVIPAEKMHHSGSWNKDVPWLANVGKKNGIKPCSQCFPIKDGEPNYFVWLGGSTY